MTSFEKIQAMDQEELAAFLSDLEINGNPWDAAYAKTVCAGCAAKECTAECSAGACAWWLAQNAE